jgi:hypothetical protein
VGVGAQWGLVLEDKALVLPPYKEPAISFFLGFPFDFDFTEFCMIRDFDFLNFVWPKILKWTLVFLEFLFQTFSIFLNFKFDRPVYQKSVVSSVFMKIDRFLTSFSIHNYDPQ